MWARAEVRPGAETRTVCRPRRALKWQGMGATRVGPVVRAQAPMRMRAPAGRTRVPSSRRPVTATRTRAVRPARTKSGRPRTTRRAQVLAGVAGVKGSDAVKPQPVAASVIVTEPDPAALRRSPSRANVVTSAGAEA